MSNKLNSPLIAFWFYFLFHLWVFYSLRNNNGALQPLRRLAEGLSFHEGIPLEGKEGVLFCGTPPRCEGAEGGEACGVLSGVANSFIIRIILIITLLLLFCYYYFYYYYHHSCFCCYMYCYYHYLYYLYYYHAYAYMHTPSRWRRYRQSTPNSMRALESP